MKIEHIAFQVADPAAMADWYAEHLGFCVRRSSDEPVVRDSWPTFLAESCWKSIAIQKCLCRTMPQWSRPECMWPLFATI